MALGEPRVVAAYLITGKENALIDMGYPSSAPTVIRDLQIAGVDDIDYLLPTHVHLDHSGSCGTLAARFPQAQVRAHPIGVKHLVDPARLIEGTTELFGSNLMQQYGFPEPIEPDRVQGLQDDAIIDLGGGLTIRTVWTPGHASHHLSFLMEQTRALFTGDCVGVYCPDIPTLIPTTPPPSFDLDQSLASIERARTLKPAELYTPHFGAQREPETWLDLNEQKLLEWKNTITLLLSQGYSSDSIAREQIIQISKHLDRLPKQLPFHLRTLIRIDTIGFIRWLRNSEIPRSETSPLS